MIQMPALVRAILLFVLAGLLEIGGGYLVWLWSWGIDGRRPDAPDVLGALLCVAGVGVIMYRPRG